MKNNIYLLLLTVFLSANLFGQIQDCCLYASVPLDNIDDQEVNNDYKINLDDTDKTHKSGGSGVWVCKFCGHDREYSWSTMAKENPYPPHTPCPKYWEGHFYSRVGLPGNNKYKCLNCNARVSVQELGFDYQEVYGCLNKYKHNWRRVR